MAILGIDTSNYRTSICILNDDFKAVEESHPLLPVPKGERGLQQSTAVFEHLKSWQNILRDLKGRYDIKAIGVSVKPRPVDDSYMPVFKVGEVLAQTLAHFLSVPYITTSHQEGHIAAGEYSALERPHQDTFIAVHLSGGTSEVLHVYRHSMGYDIVKLGGTLDLHAGQFVDRIGVALGLQFPSGPHLEHLAASVTEHEDIPIIPSFVQGVDFSFSGPTTAGMRHIDNRDYSSPAIARAVERNISKTLEKSVRAAVEQTRVKEILLVGGVAANQYILSQLKKRLEHPVNGAKVYTADPRYATDNAFGVACLANKRIKDEQ
ncbi:O-sialoglycoprotein endopeptidase [Caldalkalibacillus salinus]|uniref:Kae1-like domain-containing protein n=1 Tax=Caldalkalibacillus salinus TaxID=2803787 RepID=UPI001920915A|nr:O-sialoglycoprotein endopeptidase [Caldalkalibacillus salinus]